VPTLHQQVGRDQHRTGGDGDQRRIVAGPDEDVVVEPETAGQRVDGAELPDIAQGS
jgi:hypothetical protein